MSYANCVLYGSTLPTYQGKQEKKEGQEVIKADDPKNKKMIRQMIASFK